MDISIIVRDISILETIDECFIKIQKLVSNGLSPTTPLCKYSNKTRTLFFKFSVSWPLSRHGTDKGQETENLKKEFEFYLSIYILPLGGLYKDLPRCGQNGSDDHIVTS